MIALAIVIFALIAFISALILTIAPPAEGLWRERVELAAFTLLVTVPPLALAIGAAT